ncbi:hypothetical protein PVAND_009538 [Polypedilum vanderplanki]|uniref:Uncharacterized protein n=1 Tax=Polypedilum vanderplanki TaxID=319348 RepID=A0A9J6CDK6_POLVA|nr:hypothetical protein PVAND_009538 [Polypedilum vanderplanki]
MDPKRKTLGAYYITFEIYNLLDIYIAIVTYIFVYPLEKKLTIMYGIVWIIATNFMIFPWISLEAFDIIIGFLCDAAIASLPVIFIYISIECSFTNLGKILTNIGTKVDVKK